MLEGRATPMAPSSVDDLVSEHAPRVFVLALALTRDRSDARELAQDAWVRALADLRRGKDPPVSFVDWMRVVLRNTWLNTLRTRRRQRRAEGLFREETADCSLAQMRASRAQLTRLFARIPPAAQAVIGECLIEGEAQRTVAARNEMTERAIEGALYRARTMLRAARLE